MLLLFFASALFLQSPVVPAKLLEIQSLIDRNQLPEAEVGARAFVAGEPISADGHFLLGYILFRLAKPQDSLSEYREGAKYREPQALDLAVMGSDAFLLEDYAAADQWFTKATEKDGADANVWYQLGRTKYNEKAEDYLGLSYEHLGKTEEALAAYRKAVTLGAGHLDLGTLLAESGRAEEAVSPLMRAVEVAPGDAEAHRELGKAYLALNRLELAQGEVEKAEALAPNTAPIHFLLAQVYRKRGMKAKAEAETARYAALTGTHSAPETPLTEARSLLDLGKLPDAEKAVREYLKDHAQSGEGHFLQRTKRSRVAG
jgi:tetratricopeptide (TPR) repeat protein